MADEFDDQLLGALRRWSQDDQLDAARMSRAQLRWQEQIATEEMRFHGALLDSYERGETVELTVEGGRRHGGVVNTVGRDFVAITPQQRPTVFIGLEAIVSLQVDGAPRAIGIASSRVVDDSEPELGDILGGLLDTRPTLRLYLKGSDAPVAGELYAVGFDVLTLAVNQPSTRTTFVSLGHIAEVTVPG